MAMKGTQAKHLYTSDVALQQTAAKTMANECYADVQMEVEEEGRTAIGNKEVTSDISAVLGLERKSYVSVRLFGCLLT